MAEQTQLHWEVAAYGLFMDSMDFEFKDMINIIVSLKEIKI